MNSEHFFLATGCAISNLLIKPNNDQEEMTVPTKDLPSGIYILMIKSRGQTNYVKRLVKF